MRECLQDIYADSTDRIEAEAGFRALCSWMMHSRLEPMKALARHPRLLRPPVRERDHRGHSIIQNGKIRARDFRNMDYFSTMIDLTCGKLDLKAVTTSPSVRVFCKLARTRTSSQLV